MDIFRYAKFGAHLLSLLIEERNLKLGKSALTLLAYVIEQEREHYTRDELVNVLVTPDRLGLALKQLKDANVIRYERFRQPKIISIFVNFDDYCNENWQKI